MTSSREHSLVAIDLELKLCILCLERGRVHLDAKVARDRRCPCGGAAFRVGHTYDADNVFAVVTWCPACRRAYRFEKSGRVVEMPVAFGEWFERLLEEAGPAP